MNRSYWLFTACLLLAPVSIGLLGCVGDQPPALMEQGEPIGTQLLRAVPSLKDGRFSTLLDFESKDDAVFCGTTGGTGGGGAIANDKVHTGHGAFRIDPATTRLTVKLSSLLAGRPFPASWTLVGGYFYCEHPTTLSVAFDPPMPGSQPRHVELASRTWTAVFAESPSASSATTAPQSIPSLVFDLPSTHDPIWCDDVMLIDNYKLLTSSPDDPADAIAAADVDAGVMPPWRIVRRGLNYIGVCPSRFNFSLATSDASSSGWTVDEANAMRARFHSNVTTATPSRSLTIYADGRAFWDADYKPVSVAARNPILEAQHHSPAQIEVAEGMGRVDRNTPGDTHNDGYNPTTGSYRIIAVGPRIELRFVPRNSPVLSPVLEISGLPLGKALITLEGRLIEQSTRTSSGTLLVELPAKIDRPVTVNVRIEE